MQNVIEVNNLTKEFKRVVKRGVVKDIFNPKFEQVQAVSDISFNIKKGESVAFLGQNGAGKTTTIKMMTGLIYPSSGSVSVLGFTPFDRKKELLSRIGLVMGNKAGLNWDLTPKQSFELLKEIYSIPNDIFQTRISELTKLLDAENFLNTQVRRLSLGERMKMELVGSILHNPEVLFLDEPTIGLDIISKQKVRDFLREIQQKYKVTMILTSHDMDDIERVCDRVVVINQGRKVYDDSIKTLTEKYSKSKFIKLIFENQKPNKEDFQDVEIIEEGKNYYLFEVDKSLMSPFIAKASSTYNLHDIDIVSTPLEEIIADIFNK